MIQDKKGLSAIVMTVIMVGLVLVAVGIVWVVVLNILEGQSESIDFDQKCLGLVFGVEKPECSGATCTVAVSRKAGSKGDPIDGYEVDLTEGVKSGHKEVTADLVSSTVTVTPSAAMSNPVATLRIVFLKEDNSKHYCSQIFSSAE